MRIGAVALMVVGMAVLMPPLCFVQDSERSDFVPQYKFSQEQTLHGAIEEVRDRSCPVSGGMGSHLMLKVGETSYEVHIAPVNFLKLYGVAFQKGEVVEIVGVVTSFQGKNAILAREIKRGNEVFVFRDKNGKPFW